MPATTTGSRRPLSNPRRQVLSRCGRQVRYPQGGGRGRGAARDAAYRALYRRRKMSRREPTGAGVMFAHPKRTGMGRVVVMAVTRGELELGRECGVFAVSPAASVANGCRSGSPASCAADIPGGSGLTTTKPLPDGAGGGSLFSSHTHRAPVISGLTPATASKPDRSCCCCG